MPLSPTLDLRLSTQVRRARGARRKDATRVVMLFSILGGLLAAFAHPPLRNMWLMCALGAVVAALWLLFSAREHAGLRQLRSVGLRDAVWVYIERGTGTEFQLVHLIVRFEDRSTVRVPIELGAGDDVLQEVAREAPRATVGFTPERERAFLQDPLLLRV